VPSDKWGEVLIRVYTLAVTRSIVFSLKCTTNRLTVGLCTDQLGVDSAATDSLARLRECGSWEGGGEYEMRKGKEKGEKEGNLEN